MYRSVIEVVSLVATLLCWLHLWFTTHSLEKVIRFFSGAVFIGGLSEAATIFFTGSYDYPGFNIYIGPVPLFIAIGWGANFYYTHNVATIMSRIYRGSRYRIWVLGLFSGAAGVLIDLCFDPVAVSLRWWVWQDGSAYFGVPVANFLGWFALCMGFSVAYAWSDARANLGFLKKTLVFYLLLVVAFGVTAVLSFPFLQT